MNKSTAKKTAGASRKMPPAKPVKKPEPVAKKAAAVAKPAPPPAPKQSDVDAAVDLVTELDAKTGKALKEIFVLSAAIAAFKDGACKYNVSLGIYEMDRDVGDKLRQAVLALEAK